MLGRHRRVKGVPASSVTWAQVATAASPGGSRPAGMEPDLESVQYFENLAAPYSYGIHIAEAEVDPATGYTTVTRYVVVNDAGTIVNPRNAEGQIAGGVAQGLGGALMEELVYGPDGQPQSTSFMDYLIPGSLDVPDVEVGHLGQRRLASGHRGGLRRHASTECAAEPGGERRLVVAAFR